jgi:hypothetical protein
MRDQQHECLGHPARPGIQYSLLRALRAAIRTIQGPGHRETRSGPLTARCTDERTICPTTSAVWSVFWPVSRYSVLPWCTLRDCDRRQCVVVAALGRHHAQRPGFGVVRKHQVLRRHRRLLRGSHLQRDLLVIAFEDRPGRRCSLGVLSECHLLRCCRRRWLRRHLQRIHVVRALAN